MTYKVYKFKFNISTKDKPWETIKTVFFCVEAYTDFEAYAQALTTIWNRINPNMEALAGVELFDKE